MTQISPQFLYQWLSDTGRKPPVLLDVLDVKDVCAAVEVAGAGFLNFKIHPDALVAARFEDVRRVLEREEFA